MHPFSCGQCGQTVFFDNTYCGQCGALLGYVPSKREMCAFPSPQEEGAVWKAAHPIGDELRPCANRTQYGFCNWMLDPGDDAVLCRSCRLTSVIPDLDVAGHMQAWQAIEQAKKRLVSTLDSLGLSPQAKTYPEDVWGLDFHLLANEAGKPPVLTGHEDGVITINIVEADDVQREAARVAFDEPMRTMLGHLRHEVSHYLQYRWIENTPAIEQCRTVFGDERADYAEALKRYHALGAPADWQAHFISAYASAHPWEDWAETCAHMLLIVDAVHTAAAWGLRLDSHVAQAQPDANTPQSPMAQVVLSEWLPVAQFLNAMNRSLGLRDSYPFLMPDEVLVKLNTVQALLQAATANTDDFAQKPVEPVDRQQACTP